MKHLLVISMLFGSIAYAAESDFDAYFRENAKRPELNKSVQIQEAFNAPKVYKCKDDPTVGPLSRSIPFKSSQRYTPIGGGSRWTPRRGF